MGQYSSRNSALTGMKCSRIEIPWLGNGTDDLDMMHRFMCQGFVTAGKVYVCRQCLLILRFVL